MNIVVFTPKGGCAKTTISSVLASYLLDATLIEIDYINQSDRRIDSKGFYDSFQVNFNDESSESFFEFENFLLKANTKIIDVGSVMIDKFQQSIKNSNLYSTIDLIIVPSTDGSEDFNLAVKFLENIKDDFPAEKIIFGFNRYNKEYDSPQEQFDTFFKNKSVIKKEFGIDLDNEDNWFVIEDSKAIKKARSMGIPFKSLVDEDIDELTKQQRAELEDDDKRMIFTKRKGLVQNAQKLYKNCIVQMMEKIVKKLEV